MKNTTKKRMRKKPRSTQRSGTIRAITAQQVAKKLGLSQSTVSRAFTQAASIHPKTRHIVMKAANSLGYQPNIIARSLIIRRTNIIAVVMANLSDPFYPLVLDQLAQRIQAGGRQLLLFRIPSGTHVDEVLPCLLQYKVDAIVVASATVSSRMALRCAKQGIPVVLFNRYVPGLKAAAVCCDNVAGGRAIAEYFYTSGHVRPVFVAGESDATTSLDRANGFSARFKELGMALQPSETGGDFSYEAGYQAAQRLVGRHQKPDCIFFASDVMAIGGIDAIRAANLEVPRDISVAGFDDIPIAGWSSYELTTIRQPISEMVETTAEILGMDTKMIKPPTHKIRLLEGTLIKRQTVMTRRR